MSEPTVEQMRKDVIDHCEGRFECFGCALEEDISCSGYNFGTAPEAVICDAYKKIHPPEPVEEVETVEEPTTTHDIVNHPQHYCREGAMECIDEMITLFGKDVVKHFCLCNAWKYRYRSNAKNGEEDIKKSDWYIQKYKELCE